MSMSKFDIDELVKILPTLIRENDTVKGAIITALSGIVATRDDIKDLMREMDKRFEAMDKRFEAMDKRFDGIEHQLKSITQAIGIPFEQFARNVVSRILDGEGIKDVVLKKARLPDPGGEVFPDTKEVEVDGLSEDPPVIVEVTSILRDADKVDKFLRKKAFLEKARGKPFRGFFVAAGCEFTRERIADISVQLRKHGAELLNL